MKRLEIIFELAKYCHPSIYHKTILKSTEELDALLKVYQLNLPVSILNKTVEQKIKKQIDDEWVKFQKSWNDIFINLDKDIKKWELEHEDKDYKTSLLQHINLFFGGTGMSVPSHCALCRSKRKGNFITGYYFDCEMTHDLEYAINHGHATIGFDLAKEGEIDKSELFEISIVPCKK